jgi:hypothetical protein
MGIEIEHDRFSDEDYQRFSRRLEQSLEALGRMLERPGFGVGERSPAGRSRRSGSSCGR